MSFPSPIPILADRAPDAWLPWLAVLASTPGLLSRDPELTLNYLSTLGPILLAGSAFALLRPAGRYVARIFIRPDTPEPIERIADALAAGRISSVHSLKLRLIAALHGNSGHGTCLDDAWKAWQQLPPLPRQLAQQRGWTQEELAGIEGYRGLQTRYYLPTLVLEARTG